MIRNRRGVSGWRQEGSRWLNGASNRVDAAGSRMMPHLDCRYA
ncbi:hypothetical protein AAB990_29720 [Burkholderia contaminans]|nr:hypothetical protein [Burkholderia contaminans]